MATREVARLGDLNGSYGFSAETYGMGIGYYAANRPTMVYDSTTGKLSFKIYDQDYMSFEYNSGTPRIFMGSSINAIELTTSGLKVGNIGNVQGGMGIYQVGQGFWMGYHDGAYKLCIGNVDTENYLDWDGTNLTVRGGILTNSVDVGTTGYVRGGQTDYNTGTGFWLGYSGGTHKLSIGSALGKKLLWDGTDLNLSVGSTAIGTDGILRAKDAVISGTLYATAGYIGSGTNTCVIDNTGIAIGTSGAIRGAKTGFSDTTAGFWMGYDSGAYKFRLGNDSDYLYWDGSSLTITGDFVADSIDVGTTGFVRGGQTDYNTGTGFWLGYSGGTHKLSIGSPTGKRLLWDGTNLTVNTGSVSIGTDGTLQAINAIISGTITANTGYIGGSTGWTIATGKITSAGIGVATVAGDATYAFWAGDNTSSNAEFSVTHTGSIKAIAGTIGGWNLNASQLYSGSLYLDAGNGRITCNDIIIDGVNDRIRSLNYVSGPNGSGFTLEPNLLEVGNISARGIIKTAIFEKDTISTVGGTVTVLDGDALFIDMSALDSSTLTVSGTSTFSVNDILRIKDGVNDEWLQVSSASGNTYTVTRDKASAYSANNNPAWKQGATVVNYGQTTEGGLLLTSSLTNAPYLGVFINGTTPWSGVSEKVRLGNLNGYLGYTSDTFGLGIGSVGTNEPNMSFDSTNGIRIRTGINPVLSVDYSGNVVLSGTFFTVYGSVPSHNFISSAIDGGSYLTFRNTAGTYTKQIFANNNGISISSDGYSLFTASTYAHLMATDVGLRITNVSNGDAVFRNIQGLVVSGTDGAGYIKVWRTSSGNTMETYTIPDVSSNANFVLDTGVSSLSGVRTFTSGIKIGSTSLDSWFDTGSHGSGSTAMFIGTGQIDVTISDKRAKEIQGITKRGIETTRKLDVVDFYWKKTQDLKDRKLHIGLVAQDIYKVDKALAKKPENIKTGKWINSRDDLIALCIKSIQDLDKKITKLEKENKKLKSKLGIK